MIRYKGECIPNAELKECIHCHQVKPIDRFRLLSELNNKTAGWCYECEKQYKHDWYLKKKEKFKVINPFPKIPVWIQRTLKQYGNCYIAKNKYAQKDIEEAVGFKVRCRVAKYCPRGYVLERVK